MIDSYAFGHIVVDGVSYTSDIIIVPGHRPESWRREVSHSVEIAELDEALRAKPEVLIIGTGCYGAMEVPEAVVGHIRKLGIDLMVLETGAAVEQFNLLAGKKRTAAALHLTC